PGARLRGVARTGGWTADRPGGREAVGGAAVVEAVAALGDVAWASCRPADRRALRIEGAEDAGARADLRKVAGSGGGPAHVAGRLEGVRRAVVGHAVAA